ncbi:MAG: membrane protein insertase YidC [Deltaproteobacteria bacterium]|jgi:YidC/Oxa1 family membrane protein insertase|nr:membrane protein insertase YidC [Deltaproteobacteria bacterium]
MDKRVLVTMLAMLGFFLGVNILYPMIFPPPPKSLVQKTQTQSSESALVTEESLPAGSEPSVRTEDTLISSPVDQTSSGGEPVQLAPARDITVKTPQYTAVISEKGGRLISLTLNDYLANKIRPDLPDYPQQMINQLADQPGQSLALRLISEDRNYVDLAGLNLTADRHELTIGPDETGELTLTGQTTRGLTVVKKFTFNAGSYLLGQKVLLKNESTGVYGGRLGMSLTAGPFSGRIGRYDSVAGFLGGKVFTANSEKAGSKLPADGELTRADWLGYMNQYFLAALVLSGGDEAWQKPGDLRLQSFDKASGLVQVVVSYPLKLEPGRNSSYDFNVYYGPKQTASLQEAGHNLGRSIDLGWFWFLANPLAWLLRQFYAIFGNYGVAIIIVTILIKVALWPLTNKSYKSMKEMQKIQPLMATLREKYKDDREGMNREMMQLYRTYKINPLGGCLPMLLQIPFFIAFYRVLDYALELRGAPFILWIKDLSAPDRLFDFGVRVPFLDPPTGIPVMTLLMAGSMIWQQKMTPAMGDPMQAKMMMLMPVVFSVILLNMPAGLVLYWLVNNVLSIFQQRLINRQKGKEKPGLPVRTKKKA